MSTLMQLQEMSVRRGVSYYARINTVTVRVEATGMTPTSAGTLKWS